MSVPPHPAPSIPPTEAESAELARFREEWKAEVRRNKQAASKPQTAPSADQSQSEVAVVPQVRHVVSAHGTQARISFVPTAPGPSSQTIAGLPPIPPELLAGKNLASAVRVYRNAVQCETSGQLDEALLLYRQAFRMNPHVDRAYEKEERIASLLVYPVSTSEVVSHRKADSRDVEDLTAALSSIALSIGSVGQVTGQIASIVSAFPDDLDFAPEDEQLPVFLCRLPEEVLLLILGNMGVSSLARFALVCRRSCVLALDSGIWRDIVAATYKPPQVSSIEDMVPVIEKCMFDYRRVYIEQPRVRLDGLYIAVCHYVRPGLSENHWVNISHLITYNRYLRFFPDGRVLSLLVNEEYKPQQVIPLLKYHSRMKGLLVGEWSLDAEESVVQLTNLLDSQSVSGNLLLPDNEIPAALKLDDTFTPIKGKRVETANSTSHPTAPRYVFSMTLSLKSKPVGRWNRLDIVDYSTVNIETGDIQPVALKQERPFWFSKVRSYA